MELFGLSRHDLMKQGAEDLASKEKSGKPSCDPVPAGSETRTSTLHARRRAVLHPFTTYTPFHHRNSTTQPQLIARPLTVLCSAALRPLFQLPQMAKVYTDFTYSLHTTLYLVQSKRTIAHGTSPTVWKFEIYETQLPLEHRPPKSRRAPD
jgi:hypothetical protein